jgi:hypothetical protein
MSTFHLGLDYGQQHEQFAELTEAKVDAVLCSSIVRCDCLDPNMLFD